MEKNNEDISNGPVITRKFWNY